jgi:hypothetical protein
MSTKRAQRPSSKDAWFASNDRGPHTAVLPSGAVVRITIPDSSRLALTGALPVDLRETALLVAAHPEGAEGYFGDLVSAAIIRGKMEEAVTRAIELGMRLTHELVAGMVVEPEISAEDVASGALPELDLRMLLEIAERRRSTDAVGNKLPIVTLEEYARFRHGAGGTPGPGAGSENGADAAGGVSEPDEDAV